MAGFGLGWSGRLAMAATLAAVVLGVSVGRAAGQADGVTTPGLTDLAPSEVRVDFAAGVRALHNFWWEEAEDRFARVASLAPDFALAYWGQAMALHRDPFGHRRPPVDSMRAILAQSRDRRSGTPDSAHGQAYLDALKILLGEGEAAEVHPAYVEAMSSLALEYPGDVEAHAFFARALLLKEPVWGRAESTWPETERAARVALELDPGHPGALHYLIHALDRPETAARGLEAAERYGRMSTGASHAVHMPSHIYMQLGRWESVIEGNRRALGVSKDFAEATGRDARAFDAHAVDFLVYALLQTGRLSEAERLILEFRGYREAFDAGALRWYDGLWSAAYALYAGDGPGGRLPRSGYASLGESLTQVILATRRGDPAEAIEANTALQELASERDGPAWRLAAAQSRAAVMFSQGRTAEAVDSLRRATRIQDGMARPNETPSPLLPPEEQLASMLLASGRLEEADAALDALDARWPRRVGSIHLRGRVAVQRGATEEARRWYVTLDEQLRNADAGHPLAVEARRYLSASAFDGTTRLEPEVRGRVEERGTGARTLDPPEDGPTRPEGWTWARGVRRAVRESTQPTPP